MPKKSKPKILEPRKPSDPPPPPGSHEQLLQIVIELPTDYAPWGKQRRDNGDCSCGCRWYQILAGPLGADWGACTNPASPRAGLLTFEHQGCMQFEQETTEPPDHFPARGVLLIDRGLEALMPLLKNKGFRVHAMPASADERMIANPSVEDEAIGTLMGQRVLVTNRAEVFRDAAVVHEFSIIDTVESPEINERLAREIAHCWFLIAGRGRPPSIFRIERGGFSRLESAVGVDPV